jgi:hypothetical protein
MSSVANRNGEDAAERVRAWLADQTFGSLHPRTVELGRAEDSTGELAWYFDVVLPDPDPGEGTWPVAQLEEIDRATRDRALELGVPWPWYVRVRPETDEQQVDEDDLD